MTHQMRWWSGLGAAVALAAGVPLGMQAMSGLSASDAQSQPATQIPSLSEPGEGLTIRDRATGSGLVSFASTDGNGILVSVQANAATETRARSFIGLYGAHFGITDQSQLRLSRQVTIDAIGVEHARFQQQHNGVPVAAGELVVHLRGSRVMAANGKVLRLEQLPDTIPQITPERAVEVARELIARSQANQLAGASYSTPRLEILNRGLLEDGRFPSHLTWFIEATNRELRQFIWIDARSGGLALQFSQLADAKNRAIYDANGTGALPGTLKRSEGGPATGDLEEDRLYDLLGWSYDYFFSQHGRDSFNGAGGQIVGSVDWFQPGNCPNAFWDGVQTAYCDGMANEDVVHHEFTHAVTEFTAGLYYFNQSGALNESFSDIFGETIDQIDGLGQDNPADKWLIGENTGIGVIRNMMTPTALGDPGKMSDPQLACSPYTDGGGVHINSGIPNHAYALMVDGGTYNGHTISGIGLTKAGVIQYRALSVYLTSGATFLDNYNAVNQSCSDLIGQHGITGADCTQVTTAMRAVEMNLKPTCANYVSSPPLCPSGGAATNVVLFEDFTDSTGWTSNATQGPRTWFVTNFWGEDTHAWGPPDHSSVYNMMSPAFVVPPNGRLHFEHAFFQDEFNGDFFDGGVIEYSNNGGASWTSAQSLIEAGRTYNGTLDPSNPLGAIQAFVFDSYGYTGTRLNLSSLAGQSIIIRFRVSNDFAFAYDGWVVDNVQAYSCPGGAASNMIQNGDFAIGGTFPSTPPPPWIVFSLGTQVVWDTSGGTFNYQRPPGNTQGVILQQTGVPVPAFTALQASFTMSNSDPARKRFSVLIHDADFTDLTVCTFWMDGVTGAQPYTMRTHTTKAWTNATISIYAASVGAGGFYSLDNVTMNLAPSVSTERTDCVDPAVGAGGISDTATNLIANGAFSGTSAPWIVTGNIQSQLSPAGVFEFFKLPGLPAGVVLQPTNQGMVDNQRLRASFQLGNSSGLRQRVTVLIHDLDFSDLHACTFFLGPGLPLSTFGMRTYVTESWSNATFSVYPSTVGSSPSHEWLQLDNVSLVRTTTGTTGTECYEPGDVPATPGLTGQSMSRK